MRRVRWPAATRSRRSILFAVALLAAGTWIAGCSTIGYYGQAALGQTRILLKRQDVARLASRPGTPDELRRQLEAVLRIREFASSELGLPDNGSYRAYVELPPGDDGGRRRAVVWNVVAAPELDTSPLVWCFPIAGCVSYRGYFSEARARRFAERLRAEGYDVDVAGAAAYSTLGWFRDPVLSTVIDYPRAHLAGLLFHELAHQLLYVPGDSRFNESFATAVEIEGVRRFLDATGGDDGLLAGYLESQRRERDFVELALSTRDQLQDAYGGDGSAERKRERKQELFAELEAAYRELRESWGEPEQPNFDHWFERELNNARLASLATYHDLVPAFQALLADHGGDLEAFYDAVHALAALDPEARARALDPPICS